MLVFLLTVAAWMSSDCPCFNLTPHGLNYYWGSLGESHSIWLMDGQFHYQTVDGARTMHLKGDTESDTLEIVGAKGLSGIHWSHMVHYKIADGVKESQPYWHHYDFDLQLIWPLLLSLPLTILGVSQIFRLFLATHNRPGFCRKCGYNLHATPDRCPECGLVVPHLDADISVAQS